MKIIQCDQYSPEWWAARRGIPTASEFGSIITPKTMRVAAAAETYINRLLGDTYDAAYPRVGKAVSDEMRRGTEYEPESRAWFNQQLPTSRRVEEVGFVMGEARPIGCSPDGLIYDDTDLVAGLELKNPSPHTHVSWLFDGWKIPDDHMAQVHGSMIVTGIRKWFFVSYCPGLPPLAVLAEWNDYTDKLSAAVDTFLLRLQSARERLDALRSDA